jgi:Leucine-rich repeat (LRR) protein
MSRKCFSGVSRYLVPVVVLVSLLTLLIPVSGVQADSVVAFPDPNLEAVIREAIGKPTGDIYQSDLVGLAYLDGQGRSITDLTGLEYCTDLVELYLINNQISDLSPLSGLTSLTYLYLSNNQISDLSPLSGLTSLILLYLSSNQISDLSPLSGLTSLTYLHLDANQISDLSPLSGLTGLTHLYLFENQISDLSPLSGLTSLKHLYLFENQISDLSPLSGLTNLTGLMLGANQISDISPLSGLTNLTLLYLLENQISDISPLSGLTSLTSLRLYDNQISDISPLSGLTNLTLLYLSRNQISDISPLSGLTNLTELLLGNNQISDIQPLVDNPGIASGDIVDLRANPLSSTSLDTYVPALEARGVTVYWDYTPPTTPVVTDDGATTESTSELHATWSSSDPESGIAEYQYAIGTTSGGTDILDWTSAGTSAEVTKTGLSLTVGNTYYFAVKAKNGDDLWSEVGVSDGIVSQAKSDGGMPVWAWVIIAVAVVAVLGAAAYLIRSRLAHG